MAKYPYYILPAPQGSVYKPFIPVRLSYPKTHKVTNSIVALIDSGADVCFCSEDIGIWLGINKKKVVSFTAANNQTFDAYPETTTLYACSKNYSCTFYFSSQLTKKFPVILGQKGFFDHFKISFDFSNREIEIS